VAEQPRQLRKFLRRAAAPALITVTILASAPGAAQSPPHPSPPVETIGPTIENLDSNRGTGAYPLFTTVDLHTGSATARQALVIIHGRLRNASDYFATGLAMVKAAGAAGEATVVVAPQFLDQIDAIAHYLSGRYLQWNYDWEDGAPAQSPAPLQSGSPAASSYDVLDDVVAKLSKSSAFPLLRRIVFVGHGGGAQILARYAVVMHPPPGPPVSFVIANAGTYLYPITARPVRLACPDFNRWKYGLDNSPPYVKDAADILKDFAARKVTLLLGTKDRKTSGILDQSCAARTQGRNRFERGRNFAQILTARGVAPQLKYVIVPGVGHNERGMLLSSQAGEALFATGHITR
jgi:hypothetical protein